MNTPEAFERVVWAQLDSLPAQPPQNEPQPQLQVVTAEQFLHMELPERQSLLAPWLPEQGLAMVYAPRGIGKTFFALNVAYAIATGGQFLKWQAPTPRRVLYVDGEMPAFAMQERLADIIDTYPTEAPEGFFQLITPDLQQEIATLNLSTQEGQQLLEPWLEGVDLIVVDNISTLCHDGNENDADSWTNVQQWALKLRSRGKSILFVHHAGKGGNQRGTSRREDTLDTVISLKRPADYTPQDGAQFEIHFEKSRGFCGEDADPLEAQLLQSPDQKSVWTWRMLEDSTFDRVIELLKDKELSQADIARELNINRSTVSRHAKKAKTENRL